ncbi:MAG TPA: hypothetical protein VIY86_14745, partial [Pirellulaceae bacterium]
MTRPQPFGPQLPRLAAMGLLILALPLGCRYRDPSIDLLEGELRWMEDQVYMLEDELDRKCRELAACRTPSGTSCEWTEDSCPVVVGPSETGMILETPQILAPDSTPEYEVVPS